MATANFDLKQDCQDQNLFAKMEISSGAPFISIQLPTITKAEKCRVQDIYLYILTDYFFPSILFSIDGLYLEIFQTKRNEYCFGPINLNQKKSVYTWSKIAIRILDT